MLWQLIGTTSRHTPPHATSTCERRSPSLLELRTDAELTLRRIDKVMRTTRCHYCSHRELYATPPSGCPCSRGAHIGQRYSDQRPAGVPIEHSGHAGAVLSIR
jgi:hypothetical protein